MVVQWHLTNKNQCGRSMVEMLGVLAIIGVLSVGGIAGYRTAMEKNKTNEIINGLSIESLYLSTQALNKRETLTLSRDQYAEISFESDYIATVGGNFYISLLNVDQDMCSAIINSHWSVPFKIQNAQTQSELTSAENCTDNIQMEFLFTPNLGENTSSNETNDEPTVDLCADWVCPSAADGCCHACDPETGETYRTDGATSGPCKA